MLGKLENGKNEPSQCWETKKMIKTTFHNNGKDKNGERELLPNIGRPKSQVAGTFDMWNDLCFLCAMNGILRNEEWRVV